MVENKDHTLFKYKQIELPFKSQPFASLCEKGIHVFPSAKKKEAPPNPRCIYCDRVTVEWDRVRDCNFLDIEYTISALKGELCRYEMWTKEIDIKAVNHAKRKGRTELISYVQKRILSSIGIVYPQPDGKHRPFRDGFQTPYSGNIVYYAQHATACCCRKCVFRWHGIDQHRDLTIDEINYFTKLIMYYIDIRIPLLTTNGERVPHIRHRITTRK